MMSEFQAMELQILLVVGVCFGLPFFAAWCGAIYATFKVVGMIRAKQ